MIKINNHFDIYRSPREQLIELYLETKNKQVLERLIERCGELVLLELDWEGYNYLSQIIFFQRNYNLFLLIENPKLFKKFTDFIIDSFLSEEVEEGDSFQDMVIEFITNVDFNLNVTSKAIMKERYGFLLKLLVSKKNSKLNQFVTLEDIKEAIVKNRFISLEVLYEMIKSFPDLTEDLMENIHLKLEIRSSIFNLISSFGKIKDILLNLKEKGELIDVDLVMTKGIDKFLDNMDIMELYFPLFCSIRFIPTNIIEYRRDLFELFFQRFTIIFKEIKDSIDHVIENEKEREGIFPLGIINQEIMEESPDGLAYALYHGNTIRAYQLARVDRFLMDTINLVEYCFGLYVHMNILPENYLESDSYYNDLISIENNKTVDSVTTEFDISELLDDLE